MKINRSTKCSLKLSTASKMASLDRVLCEYGVVVNEFITLFWEDPPGKTALLKPVVDSVDSWLTARLRKVAAREALDMVSAARARYGDKAVIPTHRGTRMCVSSTIASLEESRSPSFDYWLHLASMGGGIVLDLPVKGHKHFNRLLAKGRRQESYIITRDYVQLCFEVETGEKRAPGKCLGVDTGLNTLAALSTGEKLGVDIKSAIERVNRCQHGSKGQLRASRALRQRMDEVARDVVSKATLVVVESLTGITKNTRGRLGKQTRSLIGRWNVRYWLDTLQRKCEDNRVALRSVDARYTSQMCHSCGFTDKGNRNGSMFKCRSCNHTGDADVNAARNILSRFLTGPYGAGCKPL